MFGCVVWGTLPNPPLTDPVQQQVFRRLGSDRVKLKHLDFCLNEGASQGRGAPCVPVLWGSLLKPALKDAPLAESHLPGDRTALWDQTSGFLSLLSVSIFHQPATRNASKGTTIPGGPIFKKSKILFQVCENEAICKSLRQSPSPPGSAQISALPLLHNFERRVINPV